VPMWRIFPGLGSLGKGSTAGVAPNGLFPGGSAGTRASRSRRCGGEEKEPDCGFTLFSNVFLVKVLVLSSISLSLRDFAVNLYPPLN
jgi:hypothetical protein